MERQEHFDRRYKVLAFGLSIILCGLPFLRGVDISVISDEIGAFATAPFLAGFDWSYALTRTRYYGFGYYWIAFIMLKITDNYKLLYLGITAINFVLCCSMSLLIFHVLVNHLKLQNNYQTAIAAALCTTFRHNTFGIANEYPLFIVVWLICWNIAKLYSCKAMHKENRKYTIILSMLCIYALTIHERMLAILLAIVITIVIFRLVFNLSFLNEKIFVICVVGGVFFQRLIRRMVVSNVWSLEPGQKITNMTTISGKNFLALKSWGTIRATIDCILTNLYKASLSSYGLAFAAILIAVGGILYVSIRKIKKMALEDCAEEFKKSYLIIWIFGMTILIVMVGLATKGAKSISEGYATGEFADGYKHFFYLRYYQPFIGPVFAATYAIMIKKAFAFKRYFRIMIAGSFLVFLYFCLNIFPRMQDTVYLGFRTNFCAIISKWWNDSSTTAQWFNVLVSFLVFLGFCALISRLDKKRNQSIFYILIITILVRNASMMWNERVGIVECTTADASYEFIQNIQDDTVMPPKIYCAKSLHTFQFVLNRYSVVDECPDVWEENVIFFAPENYCDREEMEGFYYTQLDENEYVYLKGEQLVSDVARQYSLSLCMENANDQN